MKTLKLFIAIFLLASMLVLPTLAAEFVPSIEDKDGPELNKYILEEIDTPCRSVLIIPSSNVKVDDFIDGDVIGFEEVADKALEDKIRESLEEAKKELESNSLSEIVIGFEEAWLNVTGGAPVENAIIYDLFEIVLTCSEAQDVRTTEKVTVVITVAGIGPDDKFLIIHKPTDSEKWIVEDYTIDENGTITMTLDKLSPFAVVKDNAKGAETDEQSPQTGVYDTAMVVTAIFAIILVACGVVISKKLRKNTVQ